MRVILNRLLAPLAIAAVLAFGVAATPAPYTEEPVSVNTPVGLLSGTLMIPAGNGPFPVALIIAGSGPTDRNGNSYSAVTVGSYKKLAIGLAGRGIATLRYDKRGVGSSVDIQPESQLRFPDYSTDAEAMADVLEKDRRFSSVSLIGHSEGSLIGILTAQNDPIIAKVVTLEGAGRNLSDVVDEQVEANKANPPAIVAEVVAYNASLRKGVTIASPDPVLAALFRPSVQPYLISEYAYDPAVEIAKVHQPVLIVQGTHDIQVSVNDAQLLAKGQPNAKLAIIDGTNHMLVDAPLDRAANIAAYTNAA